MKSSRSGILVILILILIVLGLTIIGPRIVKKKDIRIPSDIHQMKDIIETAKGVVESEEEIEITSKITGTITKISADKGDVVKKGEPLVIFDNEKVVSRINMAEAMINESKAHLKELETGYRKEDIEMAKNRAKRAEVIYEKSRDEYERQKRLYSKDATTLVEFDRAEERFKVASEELNESKANLQKFQRGARIEEIERTRANVAKASSELEYYKNILKDYTIISPIQGVVIERFRDDNETVDIGTPILTLINPKKIKIRAELEETDVGKVSQGQDVEVYTDAYKNKVYHGKVYKVSSAVKRKSQRSFDPVASFDINTQEIYIKLDDFSGLKHGMSVTVRFLK